MQQETVATTSASINGAIAYLTKRNALHKVSKPVLVLGRNVVLLSPRPIQSVKTP